MTTHLQRLHRPIGHDGRVTTTPRTATPFARAATAILALAAMLATMVTLASPAAAHARLEASSPKDGSTLTATPPEVMLRFNEPVKDGLNQVSVKSGSTDVTDGDLELAGNTVYQPLKTDIDAGDYTITYKVVSADGHPISGSVKFTYAPPEGDQGAGEPTTSATSGTSSDAPSSSSSTSGTTPPPASSTSEPTTPSSTQEPSTSSSTSPEESASTSPTDGETAPSLPDDSGTTDAAGEEATTDDDSGTPWWAWAAGLGGLLVILAGIGLLLRGRRDPGDAEEIDLDEWRD
mgnify:CR=1 FL=1